MVGDEVDTIGHARWPGVVVVLLLTGLVATAGVALVRGALSTGVRAAGHATAVQPASTVVEVGDGARVDDGAVVRVGTTERGAVHAAMAFSLAEVPPGRSVAGAQLRVHRRTAAGITPVYELLRVNGDLGEAAMRLVAVTPTTDAVPLGATGRETATDDGEIWLVFDVTREVAAVVAGGGTSVGWVLVDRSAGIGPAQVALFAADDPPPELVVTTAR